MPVFEIARNGKTMEVDAPDQATALRALGSLSSAPDTHPAPSGLRQFASDLWTGITHQPKATAIGFLQGAENVIEPWVKAGPHRVHEGLTELGSGQYAKGAHDVVTGAGITAAPMLVPSLARAAIAAPVATGASIVGGAGGATAAQMLASKGASALGATPDQSTLVGDVAAIGGGALGAKVAADEAQTIGNAVRSWRAARASKNGVLSTMLLMKAVPPSASSPYTPEQFHRAAPYLDVEHAERPITSVEGLRDAADSAVGRIEALIGQGVQAHPNDLIRTKPLDAVRAALESSPRGDAAQKGLQELSDLGLDGDITITKAEAVRQQLNAENKAILKKNSYDRATAMKADPGFAARETAARSLRDGIYDQLEARGLEGVRALRQDEGALLSVRNAAQSKLYRADARVAGTGTSSTARRAIGDVARLIPKAGPYVADAIAKPNQTRDALIEKAFGMRPASPAPTMPTMPPDAPIRGALPAPAIRLGGVADTSAVTSTPAAPMAYALDPMVPAAQGFRVAQFSSDPAAAKAAVATPEVRSMLQRMLDDLDTFVPERGRLVRDARDEASSVYAHGGPGSPVGDDIRVISEQNVGNVEIKQAVKDLLAGKTPSNRLHTAALDAAMGYLEKRPGYRGPVVPEGLSSSSTSDDDAFEAFSRAVEAIRGSK